MWRLHTQIQLSNCKSDCGYWLRSYGFRCTRHYEFDPWQSLTICMSKVNLICIKPNTLFPMLTIIQPVAGDFLLIIIIRNQTAIAHMHTTIYHKIKSRINPWIIIQPNSVEQIWHIIVNVKHRSVFRRPPRFENLFSVLLYQVFDCYQDYACCIAN